MSKSQERMNKSTTDVFEWVSGLIESAANQPLWKADQMIGIPFYRLVEMRDRLAAVKHVTTRRMM